MSAKAILATIFVCFCSPIVHWLALGPEVPQITFVQVSYLPALAEITDPSDFIYFFLRSPIYALLGWLYLYPAAFGLVGLAAHGLFNLAVFVLAFRGLKRAGPTAAPFAPWMVSLITVVLVFPLAKILAVTGHGTTLVPHDTYHTFSFRSFFWILAVVSYILAVERRFGAAILVMAVSCSIHPSAGVVGFALLSLSLIWWLSQHWDRRLIAVWILAAMIAVTPNLIKYYIMDLPPELTGTLSYGDWYSQLIKDEADDFSVLYQFARRTGVVAMIFAILGSALGLYAWLIPGFWRHFSFWATLAVPGIFLLAALIEYVFAVLYPTFLVYPISALTIGYRLLSYAFAPVIVVCVRVAAVVIHRAFEKLAGPAPAIAVCGVIATVWVGFLTLGAATGALGVSVAYATWALRAEAVPGLDAYFLATQRAGGSYYWQYDAFAASDPFVTHPGERNIFTILRRERVMSAPVVDENYEKARTLTAFIMLVETVRQKIPAGEGLFIPPHLRYVRDALVRHAIFFQEHPDGNLMMVSPAFMKFWNDRMVDLIGMTYEEMPSKHSGLMFTAMRDAYLAIDTAKALKLREKYRPYRYFITESQHWLDFAVVAATPAYVIYDLSKPY